MELTYTVIFEPAEEGGYLAHVPALNDATTQGDTLEDARFWVKDLIQGYLESLLKSGQPIPTEHTEYEGEKVTIKLAVEVA